MLNGRRAYHHCRRVVDIRYRQIGIILVSDEICSGCLG